MSEWTQASSGKVARALANQSSGLRPRRHSTRTPAASRGSARPSSSSATSLVGTRSCPPARSRSSVFSTCGAAATAIGSIGRHLTKAADPGGWAWGRASEGRCTIASLPRRQQTVLGRIMLDADHPREACGVFGVWAPGEQVANLVFYGLYALQHRGQESAGMAVGDGRTLLVYKDMGLVSHVFDERTLATLQGHLAIGHTRYSTTGGSCWENAQPTFKTNAAGGGIALAHNGNLTNTAELAAELGRPGTGAPPATTDTDVIAELLAREADLPLEEAIVRTMRRLRGAYSMVVMDERTVWGVRDPHGVRPLCIGRLTGGWVIASETAALDIVGASYVREVEPGEIVAVDELGL